MTGHSPLDSVWGRIYPRSYSVHNDRSLLKYIADSGPICGEIKYSLQSVGVLLVNRLLHIVFPDICLSDTAINKGVAVKRILLAPKMFYGKATGFCIVIIPKYFMDPKYIFIYLE